MENMKFGYLKGIECKFVKTDPVIVETLSIKTGIPADMVKSMMRYNIFTINQFCTLTQLADSTVRNKIRPTIINGELNTELDYCFPFNNGLNEGPLFIVRNEKSEKYLKA
jgi:hypothetical protein